MVSRYNSVRVVWRSSGLMFTNGSISGRGTTVSPDFLRSSFSRRSPETPYCGFSADLALANFRKDFPASTINIVATVCIAGVSLILKEALRMLSRGVRAFARNSQDTSAAHVCKNNVSIYTEKRILKHFVPGNTLARDDRLKGSFTKPLRTIFTRC